MTGATASLVITALRAASGLLEFIERYTANDDDLKTVVDQARGEGREVNAADVRSAITDMKNASARLNGKLGITSLD